MPLIRKIEVGTIITLVFAMISFAFWLGRLTITIENVKKGDFLEKIREEEIKKFENTIREISSSAYSLIGAINPINVVLGTPGAPIGANYIAPYNQIQDFPIVLENIPIGSRIVDAWYQPIDNIPDLNGFGHIETRISNANTIILSIQGRPGREALLRILIHAVYAPA